MHRISLFSGLVMAKVEFRAGKQTETVLFDYPFVRTLNQMRQLRGSISNSVAHDVSPMKSMYLIISL